MANLKIGKASRPAVCVAPSDSVLAAVRASIPEKVGAVAVVHQGKLVGILSERDVMFKVIAHGKDPATTPVEEVMTKKVITVTPDTPVEECMRIMLERHIRHLPISPDGHTVTGMVSLRTVLQHLVEELKDYLHHMESFLNADSPGG
ncbi:MAG: CBS domain-containing protein [Deltaproteobacteria bacterium]|nr:CBS domain-containing protein [Deltaproteobacteria bacterium]